MENTLAETWILLPILYLGLVTSIQDWKEHKIYQRHILFGLYLGLLWLLLWGAYNGVFYQNWQILTTRVPLALAGAAVSFVVGFVMWWFNVWSAADAKLFAVYTLMMPISLYTEKNAHFYSFMILLVNTYAAAFFIITGDFFWKAGRNAWNGWASYRHADARSRGESRHSAFSWVVTQGPKLFRTALGLMFILLVYRLLRRGVQEELEHWLTIDHTLLLLILFLAFRPLHVLFQNPVIFVMIVLGLAGYVGYEQLRAPGWQSLAETLSIGIVSLFLLLFRQMYLHWSQTMETRFIALEELAEHMVVSETTLECLNEQDLFSLEERKIFSADGLNDEQCQRIREHYVNKDRPGQIEVETTIAFAPFLFGGMILSILAHGVLLRFSS